MEISARGSKNVLWGEELLKAEMSLAREERKTLSFRRGSGQHQRPGE